MKKLRILTVGKVKTPHWQAAVARYRTRVNRSLAIEEIVVRDAPAALSAEERRKEEGGRVLACLDKTDFVICLDERGKQFASPEFARLMTRLLEDANKRPCFIVGGAYGLSDAVRGRADLLMSFGALTVPHELAAVLLWEQLYRAQCIMRNIPYHH